MAHKSMSYKDFCELTLNLPLQFSLDNHFHISSTYIGRLEVSKYAKSPHAVMLLPVLFFLPGMSGRWNPLRLYPLTQLLSQGNSSHRSHTISSAKSLLNYLRINPQPVYNNSSCLVALKSFIPSHLLVRTWHACLHRARQIAGT